ncbi:MULTISPECIES: type II secretion system F family protein [Micrococcaceae]|uniref:type II secretion system F family protein n=1 Tax=Micrococcaceae TaxID=1268 RepID=UPI001E608D63|nr:MULTISPECIES: type II secretion system F family protein [Micrococcaceae]
MPGQLVFVFGIVAITAAVLIAMVVVFKPAGGSVPMERRRPFGNPDQGLLTRITEATVKFVEQSLSRRTPATSQSTSLLVQAGLTLPRADFLVLAAAGTLVSAVVGFILQGAGMALLFAILVPVLARVYLSVLVSRRRSRFGEQLTDTLTMISGGLRAGHSVLRAIDAVAQEANEPTATEFSRVVNETRLGRDLQESLGDVAVRMKSDDFRWMAEAIEINREVGGDLAEVFDQVGETISERAQIKGTVKALSAEGKLSAIILMALPILLLVFLSLVNPKYMGNLFGHPVGWMLLGIATVMMAIGGFWVHKISDLKF